MQIPRPTRADAGADPGQISQRVSGSSGDSWVLGWHLMPWRRAALREGQGWFIN